MIDIYKYFNSLSPQIMNDIFKLRKNVYNLTNVYLFESQNSRPKRYGLDCIAYRASQIWKTFSIEGRDSISLKILKREIKTWNCNLCPCYCIKSYMKHLESI